MNRISLEWIHYPDGTMSAFAADGITPDMLRHYAQQAGIRDLGTDPLHPMLIGTEDQCRDLIFVLEIAGYEVETEEFTVPPSFGDIAEQEASR